MFGASLHIDYEVVEDDRLLSMPVNMRIHELSGTPAIVADTYAGEGKPDTLGCSITCLLNTSTASIHTTKNHIFIDIFSCKPEQLSNSRITAIVIQYFVLKQIKNITAISR